ncbi:glycine--tRNA ligase subunit beta [Sphingomonas sp. SFZ2018-12]|uniref:glycine--tRNA ligase subunit beta n=1 Tax=Sphingomonas sp. SFZ2018-12 TaxID=2683197 RepID=UPI001F0D5D9B|nr:glycine--tRNA ligase subunit beta [Sphingomonas sp. SFZ2018-12]MCH4891625.1 glycine--tRNA ligase subunit beta [Sphingomonas sp. SFZ2018-12]
MTDFLLELLSEEIPARMQDRARADLEKLFAAELATAGLSASEIVTYATPRRLALIARGLPDQTEAVSEELKGPPADAPDAAIDGFLRKAGLTRDALETRDVKGRATLFAVVNRPGRATADVLADAIPAIVRAFPWPKSMRWGAASLSTESLRWVRPLQGIVALFGDAVVDCDVAGIRAGRATVGHRFHHQGAVEITDAATYAETLRAAHVIVDQDERRWIIRTRAAELAREAGLELIEDEGLVTENAGLTEWPVPLLGRFDPEFLSVPPEVIQLTARVNQKYFVCQTSQARGGGPSAPADGGGSAPTGTPPPSGADAPATSPAGGGLANAFICVANIAASDGGARIVAGNQKVLAARLSDARFFYDTDLKVPLEEQAKKLEKIVFHEKLGTVADKVDRVAKLARWLCEEGIVKSSPSLLGEGDHAQRGGGAAVADGGVPPPPLHRPADGPPPQDKLGEDLSRKELADLAERAARLCKADLVTGMVGEFPELQGLMGGYYAAAQGEDPRVAAAIRDHYKPVGQGDDVPTDPVTVAVSLADKLDTIAAFFTIDERPTGSKDPFALRRSGIAAISLIILNTVRVSLVTVMMRAMFGVLERYYKEDILRKFLRISPTLSELSDPAVREAVFRDVFPKINVPEDPAAPVPVIESDRENAARLVELVAFLMDRLKVQQREAGVRHDLIDAVFALGGEDDLVRLLARVHALQAFVETADGANLLAGYKRAANILKKEGVAPAEAGAGGQVGAPLPEAPASAGSTSGGGATAASATKLPQTGEEDPLAEVDDPEFTEIVAEYARSERARILSYTPEPAEDALMRALDAAEPAAIRAVEAEDFAGAMAALASLRAPIDAFFDTVTVNDPDPVKRTARLNLLARMRAAVHRVADFSRIEG